jgi:putative oxidoreductase
MKKQLFNTNNDWTGLVLRLTTGLILFPHAMQHSTGWFNGYGFTGTMNWLTHSVHLPYFIGLLVIFIEVGGSICLVAGFACRIWALAVLVLMIGITLSVHVNNGFFMDWINTMNGEGYEYHLLFIGLCLAILLNGGGKFSVDNLLINRNYPEQ